MDRATGLSTRTRAALLLTALLVLEAIALPHREGVAPPVGDTSAVGVSRELLAILLRGMETEARNDRGLQVASRFITGQERTDMDTGGTPEIKLRQKLAELAEDKLAARQSQLSRLHTLRRRPQLKSKKRACFWKYCV